MRVVVDKKNPHVAEAFRQFGEVVSCATREITKEVVRDADVIIIRSETKVTKDLLDGSHVKFVGTATIGTDHVDLDYLRSRGIGFASAPGSNANSVAEYIVAALLSLAARKKFSLAGKTLGVVGVGNVGSKVARNARALGMNVLLNDPPLARNTSDPSYLPLEELMRADIITLHVPFTKTGPDPTHHLFDAERIGRMKNGAILINTSRGPVVDGGALKGALDRRHLGGTVLDVWEGEPVIDVELVTAVDIGTPHIAGYSFDGKLSAVKMTYAAACAFFNTPDEWTPSNAIPKPAAERISVRKDSAPDVETLRTIVAQCYDIEKDDRALRTIAGVAPEERRSCFARLRSEYGVRREFFNTVVELPNSMQPLAETLRTIGFRVELNKG